MRIAIFSTAYLPFVGGAEVAVKEITDRLPDVEFELFTARLDRSLKKEERLGNVFVHRVGVGLPLFDKLLIAFYGHRAALSRHNVKPFDKVWAVMASFGGLSAHTFAGRAGISYLLTLQEGDELSHVEHKMRIFPKRFARIFADAAALSAISTYLLAWGKKMGYTGERGTIIPNGVDVARFIALQGEADRSAVRQRIREKLGIPSAATVVVSVSRLVPKNGIADLIEAVNKLPQRVRLLIVGSGILEKSLKRKAFSLGVGDRIHFVGAVEVYRVQEYLWASDIFCRPSLSEGLGNAFLEAMAVGLPVVGTRVGGIADFLKEQETGFVCDAADSGSIAAAIERVMNVPAEELNEIRQRARAMVVEKYNWDTIAIDMNKLFLSI